MNGVSESVLCEKNIREITVFYCLRHVLTNLILKEKHIMEQLCFRSKVKMLGDLRRVYRLDIFQIYILERDQGE